MDERKTAGIFKALGDENRIRILQFLQGEEKCACKLLEELNISQPTLSHHMKILCDSGIVSSRRQGKWMHYTISPEGSARARQLLQELTLPKQPQAIAKPAAGNQRVSWVRVFSCGCGNCRAMLETARRAVSNLGLDLEVEYVTDLDTILDKGVMRMPALVLNDRVVSAGKLLDTAEIEEMLTRTEE